MIHTTTNSLKWVLYPSSLPSWYNSFLFHLIFNFLRYQDLIVPKHIDRWFSCSFLSKPLKNFLLQILNIHLGWDQSSYIFNQFSLIKCYRLSLFLFLFVNHLFQILLLFQELLKLFPFDFLFIVIFHDDLKDNISALSCDFFVNLLKAFKELFFADFFFK